jgi:hypothetical protein
MQRQQAPHLFQIFYCPSQCTDLLLHCVSQLPQLLVITPSMLHARQVLWVNR